MRGVPEGKDLKKGMKNLSRALQELQGKLYADRRYAMLIVFQGRDASGKDSVIRKTFRGINPQGTEITSFKAPTSVELEHDYLWRIHKRVPARGMIGIFNRSHYEDVLVTRVRSLVEKSIWRERYEQINAFEALLAANNVVILKFFLHISRKEQKKRFLERLDDPTKHWKFNAGDMDDRKSWSAFTAAYRDALRKCSTPWAPWYVVPADNEKARDWMVATTVVRTLEQLELSYPKPGLSKSELEKYRELL
jgi:PPK2 family polyphosphate:nucleotide phosphotransferase